MRKIEVQSRTSSRKLVMLSVTQGSARGCDWRTAVPAKTHSEELPQEFPEDFSGHSPQCEVAECDWALAARAHAWAKPLVARKIRTSAAASSRPCHEA
jgi:hypothetical protein